MARVVLPQSKLKARRRKRRMVLISVAVFLLLVLAAGATALSWAPFLRIQTIEIVGASSVGTSTIEIMVREEIGGTYGLVFAKDNALFYPRDQVQAQLTKQFPVFESVSLKVQDFTNLRIDIVERGPHALWCGESTTTPSPCFLLDAVGVVYAPAADFSGEVYVKYFGSTTNSQPKQFLNPEQFRSLAAFAAAAAQQAKVAVASVSVSDTAATMRFANGFALMFALKDDTADVLERFRLALTADPFTTHDLSQFEYLDLRFGDKLYYKLKNQ
ncbi:MAG TPA: hypothetical protein VHD31_03130 [Candidatus Paceibacterota bacterium]|nr:hypothetical protein [Candidatus Paceibacterota bacterium]